MTVKNPKTAVKDQKKHTNRQIKKLYKPFRYCMILYLKPLKTDFYIHFYPIFALQI